MSTTRAAMYGRDPTPRTVTTAPGIRAAAARSAVPRTIQLSSLRVTTVPSASTKPTPPPPAPRRGGAGGGRGGHPPPPARAGPPGAPRAPPPPPPPPPGGPRGPP